MEAAWSAAAAGNYPAAGVCLHARKANPPFADPAWTAEAQALAGAVA